MLLSDKKLRLIILALITAFVMNDQDVASRINPDRVAERIIGSLKKLPKLYGFGLLLFILVFEFALPPLSLKLRPFSKLPVRDQMNILLNWSQSVFYIKRLCYLALKALIVSQIYAEPELLASIGFEDSLLSRRNGQC